MRSTGFMLCGLLLSIAAFPLPAAGESLLVRYDRLSGTVNVDARDADARRVIQELFNQSGGAPYLLAPDFSGRVTARIHHMSPIAALRVLLDKVDGDYRMTGRTYYIFRCARPAQVCCRKCRYERKREWRFCPMCGERLE